MVSNVSPLLSPSQSDLSDASTWRSNTVQTKGTYNTSYDLLVPRTSESEPRHPSTTSSCTAHEPSHIGPEASKNEAVTNHHMPLPRTLASWSLEVGAMLLSIGSIIAIVGVLYRENDKSLERWPLAVSLNTVISTLGTLARVTLAFALSACVGQQKWSWLHRRADSLVAFERFDEAAKGPWGGTRLFVWLRARHWAALGALVIMGTIAFDPFLQAVISVQGRADDVDQGANATIGQAKNIYGGTFIFETNQGSIPTDPTKKMASSMRVEYRPDFGVVGSTYNGLRNPSTPLEERPGFTCTTGNCTWPLFTSAAVCSSCQDVSFGLQPSAEYGRYGVSIPWESIAYNRDEGDYTIWSLPTANIRNYNVRYDPEDFKRPQTTLILNTTTAAIDTIAHQNLDAMLLAFTVIRASEDFLSKEKLWNESRPVATECALFFCANAYKAVSINSALEERIVGSWSQREPRSYEADYSYYTEPIDQAIADKNAADLGNNLFDRSNLHTDLQLVIPPEALKTSDVVDRRFNVSQAFIFSTISWLFEFAGVTIEQRREDLNWTGLNNVGYPSRNYQMPLVVDALWNSTNLNTTFENVARSITTQLRNSSPDRHEGTVQQWTVHVHVNWWYLLFPVVLLTAGLLYVVLVIIESTRLRLPIWKESAIPALLYGFSDETQRLLREEHHGKRPSTTTVRYGMDEKNHSYLRLIADQKV